MEKSLKNRLYLHIFLYKKIIKNSFCFACIFLGLIISLLKPWKFALYLKNTKTLFCFFQYLGLRTYAYDVFLNLNKRVFLSFILYVLKFYQFFYFCLIYGIMNLYVRYIFDII